MSPRQPGLDAPRTYLRSGVWPTGSVDGPVPVGYVQRFCIRLAIAMGDRSIREVARAAGLSHTTLLAVMSGARWPDAITVAKLEDSLGQDLWPGLLK